MSCIYKLSISSLSEDQSDLISGLLGYLNVEAIEQTEDGLSIYHALKDIVDHIENQLVALAPWLVKEQILRSTIPNENWNKSWESSFDPIIIQDFCTVKATFHEMEIETKYTITIDPEMAFGTGHHETTFGMMLMMEGVDFANKKVMDYGTGTAILAILAEQLGADSVRAFDHDEVAIECAKRCVSLNQCRKISCSTETIDRLLPDDRYDVVMANINRQVLLDNAAEIYQRLRKDGLLLLSGILTSDLQVILKRYEPLGYELIDKIDNGGWLTLKMVR